MHAPFTQIAMKNEIVLKVVHRIYERKPCPNPDLGVSLAGILCHVDGSFIGLGLALTNIIVENLRIIFKLW